MVFSQYHAYLLAWASFVEKVFQGWEPHFTHKFSPPAPSLRLSIQWQSSKGLLSAQTSLSYSRKLSVSQWNGQNRSWFPFPPLYPQQGWWDEKVTQVYCDQSGGAGCWTSPGTDLVRKKVSDIYRMTLLWIQSLRGLQPCHNIAQLLQHYPHCTNRKWWLQRWSASLSEPWFRPKSSQVLLSCALVTPGALPPLLLSSPHQAWFSKPLLIDSCWACHCCTSEIRSMVSAIFNLERQRRADFPQPNFYDPMSDLCVQLSLLGAHHSTGTYKLSTELFTYCCRELGAFVKWKIRCSGLQF